MSFGKKLLLLRVTNKLNQKEMSERLHVSQPVYSRFENDEKEVNEQDNFVNRVAEEFNLSHKWLLAENDNTLNFATNSSIGTNSTSLSESYYNLPKDFMEVYFRQQQQMLEMILNKLEGG